MRHRVHTFKVGRSSAHRRAMLANMVSSLFTNGQIQTTLVKAKEARRFAEKLITIGKKATCTVAASRLRSCATRMPSSSCSMRSPRPTRAATAAIPGF